MEHTLDTMARIDGLVSAVDTVWVLLAAILIFMMQMGFACVEAGFTRSKNTANKIATKQPTAPTKKPVSPSGQPTAVPTQSVVSATPAVESKTAEHLALPNVDDTKQGIIASKIAAHAADIAKGIPHARDIDDKMADARRVLDWDAQYACALDPETAKAIRDSRKPEDDHSDTCSMCGKFCAVRSMNKALAGEYIDIL